MRCIRRHSITESFQLDDHSPIPGLCRGGARIKVIIERVLMGLAVPRSMNQARVAGSVNLSVRLLPDL